jgi:hypothetical protein
MREKILILGDFRIPMERRSAIERIINFAADYRPDRIILVGELVSTDVNLEESHSCVLLDRLREILALFRSVHERSIGIHAGRAFSRRLNTDTAPWLHKLHVTILPEFCAIAPGWITTHGENGPSSSFPGGKAINLARVTKKSVACGTGGQGIVSEVSGPASRRITLLGMEVGNLSSNGHSNGFAILEHSPEATRPILASVDSRARIHLEETPIATA